MSEPKATPKATPKVETELVISVSLDGGEVYELRPDTLTVAQTSALRQQSHGAWRAVPLLAAVLADGGQSNGPEEVAGLMFLARRQAGHPVTYDAVVAEVDAAHGTLIRFDDEPVDVALEDADSPQL